MPLIVTSNLYLMKNHQSLFTSCFKVRKIIIHNPFSKGYLFNSKVKDINNKGKLQTNSLEAYPKNIKLLSYLNKQIMLLAI
jgi:hypothetical protein